MVGGHVNTILRLTSSSPHSAQFAHLSSCPDSTDFNAQRTQLSSAIQLQVSDALVALVNTTGLDYHVLQVVAAVSIRMLVVRHSSGGRVGQPSSRRGGGQRCWLSNLTPRGCGHLVEPLESSWHVLLGRPYSEIIKFVVWSISSRGYPTVSWSSSPIRIQNSRIRHPPAGPPIYSL